MGLVGKAEGAAEGFRDFLAIIKISITFVINNVIMSLYSFVNDTINDMNIGEMVSIEVPDKLKAFRKFLSEISRKDHKKFTTKIKEGQLHILRINYHSVAEKIQTND